MGLDHTGASLRRGGSSDEARSRLSWSPPHRHQAATRTHSIRELRLAPITARGTGTTRETQREAGRLVAHPLVDQLRFARSEFRRCLAGVSEEDAAKRLLPMNSIGWIICHLAGQERRFWLIWAQGITDVAPELNEWGHFQKPANTPPLAGAWAAWHTVTETVDPFLDALTQERLMDHLVVDGK